MVSYCNQELCFLALLNLYTYCMTAANKMRPHLCKDLMLTRKLSVPCKQNTQCQARVKNTPYLTPIWSKSIPFSDIKS